MGLDKFEILHILKIYEKKKLKSECLEILYSPLQSPTLPHTYAYV